MSNFVQELTTDNFDSLVKRNDNELVVVDFWASYCSPCLQLAPFYEAAAEKFAGKAHFFKVDTQKYRELAIQNSVRSIPTLLLYKNGVLVHRHSEGFGGNIEQELTTFLQEHL